MQGAARPTGAGHRCVLTLEGYGNRCASWLKVAGVGQLKRLARRCVWPIVFFAPEVIDAKTILDRRGDRRMTSFDPRGLMLGLAWSSSAHRQSIAMSRGGEERI